MSQPLNLQKGQNINLAKEAPGVTEYLLGAGWNANQDKNGQDFDLDLSAILLNSDGKVIDFGAEKKELDSLIYYGNQQSVCGSLKHLKGDNRTGAGDGDDEAIRVDISTLPPSVSKIAIVISIYDAERRKQNFGQVTSAYIRIAEFAIPDTDIRRFDLTEEASVDRAYVFGELYRNPSNASEFKFKAVGTGFASFEEFLKTVGIDATTN